MTDDTVTKLPVKFKKPGPEDRTLVGPYEVVKGAGCRHDGFAGAQYEIDDSLAEVTCSLCGQKLNPMWVLTKLASEDRRFHEAHERYHEEMQRLNARSRTTCDHCGKMTKISRS